MVNVILKHLKKLKPKHLCFLAGQQCISQNNWFNNSACGKLVPHNSFHNWEKMQIF